MTGTDEKEDDMEAVAKWSNIYHHLKWQALNKYPLIGILIVCSFPGHSISSHPALFGLLSGPCVSLEFRMRNVAPSITAAEASED